MQNALRQFAPRLLAGAAMTSLFTAKAFASEAPAPGVCPVDHKAIVTAQTVPALCPVDHKAMAASSGVCPVDHLAIAAAAQSAATTPGVCPVNHGKAEPAKPESLQIFQESQKPGVCPVNHGKAAEPETKTGVCPVNHGKIPLAEGSYNHAAAEQGVCPVSANPIAGMGSHMGGLSNFVGKTYIGGSKEPKNDTGDRTVDGSGANFYQEDFHGGYDPSKVQYADFVPGGLIPAAGRGNSVDGAHWVNPTPMQLFRAIRRKEMDLQEEDALAVAFTHADVVDFSWQLVMEYENKYINQCPNIALKRFEGKYGQHTPKSWLTEQLYGIQPYDRHDWWIDRCGTEVRYIIDYYSNDEDEYWMDVRPDLNRSQNITDRVMFAYDKFKKGEKWF